MDKTHHQLINKSIEKWIIYFMEHYKVSRNECIEMIKKELLKKEIK